MTYLTVAFTAFFGSPSLLFLCFSICVKHGRQYRYGERAYDAAKSATPVGGDATAYARGSFERRRDVSLSDIGKTYK